MEKFIIDTNFFINLEIKSTFGKNPKEVIINFTDLANQVKKEKKGEFFMPPKVIDELLSFFNNEDFIKDFLHTISIKSPEIAKLQFSASVFYQLIEEIRERSYRGLRIAEASVEEGAKKLMGQSHLSRQDFQKTIGETIKTLREKYRQATRFNFLDSVADLDLITLTKELDGFLVSSDEGVLRWGRIFGIKEITPGLFRERLFSLLPARDKNRA